jgi:hypothetical protein
MWKLRARLRAEAITSLSGPIAEAELSREPVSQILRRCDEDRRQARRAAIGYALTLPDWHVDAYRRVLDDLLAETKHLVRRRWLEIQTLAERLALNGTLTGVDVIRVIELTRRAAAA